MLCLSKSHLVSLYIFFENDATEMPTERDDRLNLVDNLARHADIRGSIMQSRIHSATDRNFDEAEATLRMDAEHTRWWNHVDEYLSSCSQASSVAKLHQVTLIVLRFESVIALHRSTLATSKTSSAYDAALPIIATDHFS